MPTYKRSEVLARVGTPKQQSTSSHAVTVNNLFCFHIHIEGEYFKTFSGSTAHFF